MVLVSPTALVAMSVLVQAEQEGKQSLYYLPGESDLSVQQQRMRIPEHCGKHIGVPAATAGCAHMIVTIVL